jgi:ATP-dependent DNA helicase
MQKEEEQMAKAREKEDAKRERKLAAERQKDMKEGSGALDTKYKALEYLLSQSKLYSTIMLQQMTQQEDAETAKDEKSKQQLLARNARQEKERPLLRLRRKTQKSCRSVDVAVLPRTPRPTSQARSQIISTRKIWKPRLARHPSLKHWQRSRRMT